MAKDKDKHLTNEGLIIAYRIREARANKFRTITEAATSITPPVDKTLWSHWENAQVTPHKSTIEKLAAFFNVESGYFYQEPDDWKKERDRFLTELCSKTRVNKDYYRAFRKYPHGTGGDSHTPPNVEDKPSNNDALNIFLQITKLITDAQAKVMKGEIEQDAYDTHMQTIADMVKVSMLIRKP